MYTSLTFYYSSTLNPTLGTPTSPNVNLQTQHLKNWLTGEYRQHHQWAGIIAGEYETSTLSEVKTVIEQQNPNHSIEHFCSNFTSINRVSSKLHHSQLTLYQTRSMFPELGNVFLFSEGFQWITLPPVKTMCSRPLEASLASLLERFRVWFQYSKLYLSFYIRKVCLEEDGQLSDIFSNRLMSRWLRRQFISSQTKWLTDPFVCPTHAEVRGHLDFVKERLKRLKAVSQSRLIDELNLMLQHWVSSWDLSVRWQTLRYCDDRLRRVLQRWAKRRHPNKGWTWVCHKYWRIGPIATKYVFWLGLLANLRDFQKFENTWGSEMPLHLVKFLQENLKNCPDLSGSPLGQWQFVCLDSDVILSTHTSFSLKKWRKNSAFNHFLLY